jgi:hypothetical protein
MQGSVRLGAAILAAFSLACASSVDVSIDQRKDLTGFRTWNFLTHRSGNVRAPDGNRIDLDVTLTRLVERCLAARGFERVTSQPDFYVSYFLEVRREVVVMAETPAMQTLDSLNDSASYEIQATERRVEIHELGHLSIFVTDAEEQAVVWRGGFEGRYLGAISPHLESAVASLLRHLPASAVPVGARLDAETPALAGSSSQCQSQI